MSPYSLLMTLEIRLKQKIDLKNRLNLEIRRTGSWMVIIKNTQIVVKELIFNFKHALLKKISDVFQGQGFVGPICLLFRKAGGVPS